MLNIVRNMEEDLYKKVLPHVFKYLNGCDLFCTSSVNRLWENLSLKEELSRGPKCIRRYLDDENLICKPEDFNAIQKNAIACYPTRPVYNIFFNPVLYDSYTSRGCHCVDLPCKCYSVTLIDSSLGGTLLSAFSFPYTPLISINTFTFYNVPFHSFLYCHELNYFFEDNFVSAKRLFKAMKLILRENSIVTNCFILFSRKNTAHRVFCLQMALKYRFPNTKITMWGGEVNSIMVCNNLNNLPTCKEFPEIVIIALTGIMQVYSVYVNNVFVTRPMIEKKLNILQKNLTLKKHSIGFMFASHVFPELFDLEAALFINMFPTVPFIACYGSKTYGEKNESNLEQDSDAFNYKEITCYMIITYD